jgi:hypothetical protein
MDALQKSLAVARDRGEVRHKDGANRAAARTARSRKRKRG